jgi:hypothetical protein
MTDSQKDAIKKNKAAIRQDKKLNNPLRSDTEKQTSSNNNNCRLKLTVSHSSISSFNRMKYSFNKENSRQF